MAWEQCCSFPPQEVGWIVQAGHPLKLTPAVSSPSVYPEMLGAEGPNASPFCTWGAEGGLRFVALAWALRWHGLPLLPWLVRRR